MFNPPTRHKNVDCKFYCIDWNAYEYLLWYITNTTFFAFLYLPLQKSTIQTYMVVYDTLVRQHRLSPTPNKRFKHMYISFPGPHLQAVCTISRTADNIDVIECKRRNIAVLVCPSASTCSENDTVLLILTKLNAHQLMIRKFCNWK